jgi:hypothetical protein
MLSTRTLSVAVALTIVTAASRAQSPSRIDTAAVCAKASDASTDHTTMDHALHAVIATCNGPLPTAPGQSAFAAISEIVGLLKADPNTDWSRVNIEALRQHLIDMDDVMMNAVVTQRSVAGGVVLDVSGTGRTAAAITRMAVNHAKALNSLGEYTASAIETSTGARITVTSRHAADAGVVARIRGLGFAGLITEGNHHMAHHLAIARGEVVHH